MRITRVYNSCDLQAQSTITLNDDAAFHLLKVLRLKQGDKVAVFDGCGHEALTTIVNDHKICQVQIDNIYTINTESNLNLSIAQVLSKGDKMDFTIQKAVELGVNNIYPLFSKRCNIKLDEKRIVKKQDSYFKIIVGACEQSGRAFIPKLHNICDFTDFISEHSQANLLLLDPKQKTKIKDLKLDLSKETILIIGPEGGLDNSEIELAKEHNALGISLGPRILRTETAALVALSILGSSFGDL